MWVGTVAIAVAVATAIFATLTATIFTTPTAVVIATPTITVIAAVAIVAAIAVNATVIIAEAGVEAVTVVAAFMCILLTGPLIHVHLPCTCLLFCAWYFTVKP